MQFCDFLTKIYKKSARSNQSQFVLEIFSAVCGEEEPLLANDEKEGLYSKSLPDGLTGYDSTYRKRFFGGAKYTGLSAPIKKHILSHKNQDTFLKYMATILTESNISELCVDFGISMYTEKEAFFAGLFNQFVEFAKNKKDAADDIIQITVKEYLSQERAENNIDHSPTYPDDEGIIISGNNVVYEKTCYEKFDHSWTIKNTGLVTWEERFYEISMPTNIKTTPQQILIPTLRPNEETTIKITVDTRHFEGGFETTWNMKNKDLQICFPDKSLELKLSINVCFNHALIGSTEVIK